MMSKVNRIIGVSVATLALTIGSVSPALATPPGIPTTVDQARSELNSLTVRAEGSSTGYSRDKFPHWITQSGTCNTREEVLKRDGTNVVTDSSCAATSGRWFSPYDGDTWTAASDVDIDHVVALAEAWRSGASSWTTDQRRSFANDLDGPQLIAVTDNVNQAKGDKDPSEWKPPLTSYHCTYAKMWVHTKFRWKLTLQSSEKAALTSMLSTC